LDAPVIYYYLRFFTVSEQLPNAADVLDLTFKRELQSATEQQNPIFFHATEVSPARLIGLSKAGD